MVSQCKRVGPLEVKLANAEERFATLRTAPADDVRSAGLGALLQDLAPLLPEKSYEDPTDIENKTRLMYRASLVMAAGIYLLDKPTKSRELYMNAYLLNDAAALRDIRPLLPADVNFELFEKVHVPAYKVLEEQSVPEPARDGHAAGLRETARVRVEQFHEYYLLQMVCGDFLKQARARRPDLSAVRVEILLGDKLVALGDWDREHDEILLRYPE